jgi:tRNA modification GTPase
MYATDTIAAIATPLGRGGIGIVRVSGPRAATIARAAFARSRDATDWAPQRLYHGRIIDAFGAMIDEGLAVLMRAPRSYTGEDVVEFHCHGSPVVLNQVVARVLSCGARLAAPGEFTKRAFLNGRLDLAQAEAVIDMVRARTTSGAALAAEQLAGRLSRELGELRAHLIRLKALLEAQIDFSEEDLEIADTQVQEIVDQCIVICESLLNTYEHGKIVRDGLRVAIVGKPNVGKSSLLNALLGEERAIVTPIAGTTRDAIEETADFEGIPVVLSDTAGLRDPQQVDTVERIGIERTVGTMGRAQVLLIVIDASQALDADDDAVLQRPGDVPRLVALNKIDLPRRVSETSVAARINGAAVIAVSATERRGLADLRRAVITQAGGPFPEEGGPVLSNVRHADALAKALESMRFARQSVRDRRTADLLAVDIQDAIDQIGTITGAITCEDVLDRIFSEFCIGK